MLTKFDRDPLLDLDPWVGQRQASFRFERFNAVSGENLGEIHPVRNANLTHDTTRTIKRQLTINLDPTETAAVNPIQDRIRLFMTFPNGARYPLGVYMFTDRRREVFTSGKLGQYTLNDEMFRVDQPIEEGYSNGVLNPSLTTSSVIQQVLVPVAGLQYEIEASSYESTDAWGIGESRGSILEKVCLSGDYFSPWFDHSGVLQFIRAFDPAIEIPDFDFDRSNAVTRAGVVETDDLITSPNRFIVVSNDSDDSSAPVVGVYDVPLTAPHSITNRGYVVPQVEQFSVQDIPQALAAARNIGLRASVFEEVNIVTAPDPRFDSYNVVWWQGHRWLEIAWSMALVEGGAMNHRLRKVYGDD